MVANSWSLQRSSCAPPPRLWRSFHPSLNSCPPNAPAPPPLPTCPHPPPNRGPGLRCSIATAPGPPPASISSPTPRPPPATWPWPSPRPARSEAGLGLKGRTLVVLMQTGDQTAGSRATASPCGACGLSTEFVACCWCCLLSFRWSWLVMTRWPHPLFVRSYFYGPSEQWDSFYSVTDQVRRFVWQQRMANYPRRCGSCVALLKPASDPPPPRQRCHSPHAPPCACPIVHAVGQQVGHADDP